MIMADASHVIAGLKRAGEMVEPLLALTGLDDMRAERRTRRAVGVVFAGVASSLRSDPAYLAFEYRLRVWPIIRAMTAASDALTVTFTAMAASAVRAAAQMEAALARFQDALGKGRLLP